jgi:ATP-dependent Zn protease
MRGFSRGHHQSFDKNERSGRFQSGLFAELIHDVGAMAAELVFYGENSNGVGMDMQMTTRLSTAMTGAAGMSPAPLDLKGKTLPGKTDQETREIINRRLEDLGGRLVNRSAASFQALGDRRKAAYTTRFVGQAILIAYQLVLLNKDKVEAVADAVFETKEIFGDELVKLLDAQNFVAPEIDWTDESIWPPIVDYTPDPRRDRGGPGGDDEGLLDVGIGVGEPGSPESTPSGSPNDASVGELVGF